MENRVGRSFRKIKARRNLNVVGGEGQVADGGQEVDFVAPYCGQGSTVDEFLVQFGVSD